MTHTSIFDRLSWVIVDVGMADLMPLLFCTFLVGLALRFLIFLTVKSEENFSKEFEKRVHRHLDGEYPETRTLSFHDLVESVMNKTFYEVYIYRAKYLRRKLDRALSLRDRLFMTEFGAKRLTQDTLKQTKYFTQEKPSFENVAKFVFMANPYFNKLFGIIPTPLINDFLAVLPGLFIIGGIFGTFLGIMKGLPMLGEIDVTNVEAARNTMKAFLTVMAFKMSSSIYGMLFSVAMTLANTFFSPGSIYFRIIDRFKLSLEFLWNDSQRTVTPEAVLPSPDGASTREGKSEDAA